MFDLYNIDKGFDLAKKDRINAMPFSLRLEKFWHRFTGVFLGWMFLWILLDKRINIFSDTPNFSQLSFTDFLLFILGYIGINGRLPTIAHSVQDWIKRT